MSALCIYKYNKTKSILSVMHHKILTDIKGERVVVNHGNISSKALNCICPQSSLIHELLLYFSKNQF